MIIDNVNIKEPTDKISIYCELIRAFINKLSISSNSGRASQGGGMNCINCKGLEMENSSFKGLKAKKGGALFIS